MSKDCKKFMLYLPKCYFKNSCCVKCNEKIIDEIYYIYESI